MSTFKPELSFIRTHEAFKCPYCTHELSRVAHGPMYREHTLVAAITRHVHTCYTVLLYRAGYVFVGDRAIAVTDLDPLRETHRKALKNAKASHCRRHNEALKNKARA